MLAGYDKAIALIPFDSDTQGRVLLLLNTSEQDQGSLPTAAALQRPGSPAAAPSERAVRAACMRCPCALHACWPAPATLSPLH